MIVVEHDEDVMKAADYIIDIGPEAGFLGGELVFAGDFKELKNVDTLTSKYLTGRFEIEVPEKRRKPKEFIKIKERDKIILKNIDVEVPWKFYRNFGSFRKWKIYFNERNPHECHSNRIRNGRKKKPITIRWNFLKSDSKNIELIDQNPIGKSSRSNPVTYLKAYDDIRDLLRNKNLQKFKV